MSHPYPSRPIRVLHLSGTPYEVGRQHAEAVGEEIVQGMAGFYSSFWNRMMNPELAGARKLIFSIVGKLIDPLLIGRLAGQLPETARALIAGLSGGDDRRYRELVRSTVLPDMMPILLSMSAQLRPLSVIPASDPPLFGCSSFFAKGDSLLHGRNLDFPGVAYWDRYPVIQMTKMTAGLKYIGFTTAGVPMCGVTGVNEAQLSVALHQHYGRNYSFSGTPPFVIAEQILENARTIQEAENLLENARVSAAWAFLIGDGKTGEAAIFECDPRSRGVVRLHDRQGTMAHSNYFQTPNCRQAGYATTSRMNWDNYWRRTRLENNVREAVTPELACRYLSEHVDGFSGKEKMANRTVSQVFNVQSVLLDLGAMKAWVAEGDCPIHLRGYTEFDLGEIFQGREGKTGRTLAGYQFQDSNVKAAKENFVLGFKASFDGDDMAALEYVERTLTSHVSTEAALVGGVLAMKRGKWDLAEAWLEGGVAAAKKNYGEHLPPEYFETLLFLARCCDLKGSAGAPEHYRTVREHPRNGDAHLKKLASPKRPYTMGDLSRVLTPFSSYIPFE